MPFSQDRYAPTVMFEDPDGRARQTGAQHQRRVVQLITQNETTLKQKKKKLFFLSPVALIFIFPTANLLSLCEH